MKATKKIQMLTIDLIEMGLPKSHHYLLGAVGPRPICFASTVDEKGVPNLAPFSFFNVLAPIHLLLFFLLLEVVELEHTKTHSIM